MVFAPESFGDDGFGACAWCSDWRSLGFALLWFCGFLFGELGDRAEAAAVLRAEAELFDGFFMGGRSLANVFFETIARIFIG